MEELIDDTKKKGYKIVLGGERLENNPGYFYKPTIIEADINCPTAQKEAFGPIFTLLKVEFLKICFIIFWLQR